MTSLEIPITSHATYTHHIMEVSFLRYLHLSLDCFGLSSIPGFEIGGHLDSMLNHIPSIYFASVAGSFLLVLWAYMRSTEESNKNEQNAGTDSSSNEAISAKKEEDADVDLTTSFEISATDECEFIPLVSEEEDRRIAAEIAPKTKFMELDPSNPGVHLNMYLDCLHQGDSSDDGSDDLDKVANFRREDLGQYVTEKDLHVLDDPRESPSRRGTVMSRVKKARQRALRNAVEKDMNAEDRLKEQMAANQMLSKVYGMMRENPEMFGETSFDNVRSQMDLYKA